MVGKDEFKSFLNTYWMSVGAASIAEFATYPLDLTKTRLQIQGELAAKAQVTQITKTIPYRGMLKTAYGIVTEEGFFHLWKGITPAIWRHMIYSPTRLIVYENLRSALHKDVDGTFKLWKSIVCGVSAGAIAQFMASPADLVKVQMMMEGKHRLMGGEPRIKTASQALFQIYHKGGVRGLWKGCVPNVQRAALVNLGDLTAYDMAKTQILKHTSLKDNYISHFIASSIAGLVAATLSSPADVIKSRVMNQPTDSKGRGLYYKSSYDCLVKTVKTEGFFALYKGFLPVWMRLGPWALIFWLSYEQFRYLSGFEQF